VPRTSDSGKEVRPALSSEPSIPSVSPRGVDVRDARELYSEGQEDSCSGRRALCRAPVTVHRLRNQRDRRLHRVTISCDGARARVHFRTPRIAFAGHAVAEVHVGIRLQMENSCAGA